MGLPEQVILFPGDAHRTRKVTPQMRTPHQEEAGMAKSAVGNHGDIAPGHRSHRNTGSRHEMEAEVSALIFRMLRSRLLPSPHHIPEGACC